MNKQFYKQQQVKKNAGDFPKVVQSFKELGVTKYQFLVEKGIYVFWDEMDNQVESKLNGVSMPISEEISRDRLKDAIKQAQAGKIDFEIFIKTSWASRCQTVGS